MVIYQCKNKKITKKYFILTIIIIILFFAAWNGYGFYRIKKPENGLQIKIALLQTNFLSGSEFNTYQEKDVFDSIKELFKSPENIKQNPDIIVAPEGFSIVAMSGSKKIAKYVLGDFWQPGQIFMENQKTIDENQKIKSRLFYYDLDQEQPIAFYDKMFLMPNGDYLPYLTKLFLGIYSFNLNINQRFFERGKFPYIARTPKGNIGGSICTGFLSPNMNREMTDDGAEILMSVSSDAPFHGSKTLLNQILAISKFRAVENNRYFGQSANMGYSFLINSKGKTVNKSDFLENNILFANAKLINNKTLYTKFGDWVLIFSILLLILVFRNNIIKKRVY